MTLSLPKRDHPLRQALTLDGTILLTLIGFISLLAQVVVLREIAVAYFGVELALALALAVWLLGTGLGAWFGGRSWNPPRLATPFILILIALLIPLDIFFIRYFRVLLGGIKGTFLPLAGQLGGIAASAAPLAVCSGLLFQWAAKRYISSSGSFPLAYAIESMGSVAGGLISLLLLTWGVQNLSTGLLCSGLTAAAALYSGLELKKSKASDAPGTCSICITGASILTLCGLVLAFFNWEWLDERSAGWTTSNLVLTKDSPYGRIAVSATENQVVVFENGALAFDTESAGVEEFVHPALLLHPQPMRILVLGGGIEGLVQEVLKYNPEQVVYVELNPVILEQVTLLLPVAIQKSLTDQRVKTIQTDPRSFLKRPGKYDAIIVGMPSPESGETNRFYTKEFFVQAALRLEDEGILALHLPAADNYWSRNLIGRNLSVLTALLQSFPHVEILPGQSHLLLASSGDLPGHADILKQRLKERNIETSLITPAYLDYLFTNDRYYSLRRLAAQAGNVINSDAHPVCYRQAAAIWLSRFLPKLIQGDAEEVSEAVLIWTIWIAAVSLVLGVGIFRRQRTQTWIFVAGLAGFWGMTLEIVLLLHFQTTCGVLYQYIGFLIMLFMFGLASGSAGYEWLRQNEKTQKWIVGRLGRMVMTGLIALLSFWVVWKINAAGTSHPIEIGALMLLTGMTSGGLLAQAAHFYPYKRLRVVSVLYTADVTGGACGAALASLALIPALGMSSTVIIISGFVIAYLAFLLIPL
ncbi:MAG: hypothetical protein V2A61_00130 [Calditrichota bacterium]